MRPAGREQSGLEFDDLTELVFVGLTGIVDPPRPEAIRAIRVCHEAGIRVKMITGDHAGYRAGDLPRDGHRARRGRQGDHR